MRNSEVLAQTKQHIILIQGGAKYHTSRAMQEFFATDADRLTKYQLPSRKPKARLAGSSKLLSSSIAPDLFSANLSGLAAANSILHG